MAPIDASPDVAAALERADQLCRRRGARFTPARRRVLALVLAQGATPVGAYALLEQLRREEATAAPPTIYRALDFLLAQGLIHRVARLNAFVACRHVDHPHLHAQLICRDCGESLEICDGALEMALARRAAEVGFVIQEQVVEAVGLCARCAPTG